MSSPRSAIATLALIAIGAVIGRLALADEPTPPVAADSRAQRCHLFTLADLDKDRDLHTADRTSEIGQWVAAREAEGWQVGDVDFAIGQKPTGYPQGYVHVCMSERR